MSNPNSEKQTEKYQIETKISSRAEFQEIINTNPGVIIIKLGAEWCGPCKTIKAPVSQMMQYIVSDKIRCFIIDVDDSIELYGLLKQKKW